MKKNIIVFFMTALILCFGFKCTGYAAEKIVLVTVNTSNIEELLGDQGFYDIASHGVLGLMNSKSVNHNNQYKPYLTIGSGEKSDVYNDSIEAVKIDRYTKTRYEMLTLHPAQDGEIANMWINRINEVNSKTYYNAHPGKLGDVLKYNNVKTGFIGGFWDGNSVKSPAFFICMDSFGLSDFGEVYSIFNEGAFDYDAVYNAYSNIKDDADFIVIELGEIESLYNEKKLYSEESYSYRKNMILKKCSTLVDRIKSDMDFSKSILCIMSPYSIDVKDKPSEVLSPVILYDGGRIRGILTSKTTRREGVISSIDIAPSLISCLEIEQSGFKGYPFSIINRSDNVEYISELYRDTKAAAYSRPYILKGFAIITMITLTVYAIMLLTSMHIGIRTVNFVMMIFMYIPLSMLIEGLFRFQSALSKTVFIIATGMVLSALTYFLFKNPKCRILFMASLNVLILVVDLISGQSMQKYSVLSYDAIIGARYYGMGNEYLGVMISCSLIVCSLLKVMWELKRLPVLILIFITAVIGLPWLGSNVGGLLVAAFSFLFFIILHKGFDVKAAVRAGIIWATVSFIVVLGLNLVSKGFESHLGNMVHRIEENGFIYGLNILCRKAAMGLKLIKYTIWSRVLIALIVTSLIFFLKPGSYGSDISFLKMPVKNLWITAVLACLTAILFNDSGIVTAAIIMLYIVLSTVLTLKRG